MRESSRPVVANFDSTHILFAAGVAIFHLATSRVIICRAGNSGGHFLPKGRRDAGEETWTTAVREGFEEVRFPIPEFHPFVKEREV